MTDVHQLPTFGRHLCRIDDFVAIIEQPTPTPEFASRLEQRVPVFEASHLRDVITDAASQRAVRDVLAEVLDRGAGIFVIAGAFDHAVVDRATSAFEAMIEQQHREGRAVGDHYAKPGANDRVWNAIEKLAVEAPDVFVDYYANDMAALGALAWLGPNYQISSQVNVVNPGGQAQQPHRDYHLGFMTDDQAESYPAHTHRLSPMLTLQGAVAHCDMPVETGPTMYLPFSQQYELGYLAWRNPDFIAYFDEHHTQLPLAKGDIVFFNPALFHAAGSNVTADVRRMANLLQISSAMARAMETMDRIRMTNAVYPALLDRQAAGTDADALGNALTAVADGYAFPTNLDNDPPLGGLTPPSHLDILRDALTEGASPEELAARLDALAARRRSH
ncbi:MAG: phytanoyl-CoA dioxygenase family protein [Ilumatobacteraceae bacterium]|nr:phytanoyl-CoA dioxygenase family protein [Ilumatobacteraceae bacterium]